MPRSAKSLRANVGEKSVEYIEILRDLFVNLLPVKQLPASLIRRWYGFEADFVFLTHPRDIEDIYDSAPTIRWLKIIPKAWLTWFVSLIPCYAVAQIVSRQRLRGLVVSTSLLPQVLLSSRRRSLAVLGKTFSFIRKITSRRVYVGLAAWWPIVTDSGAACGRLLRPDDRIVVTNGHTATVASIYLTLMQLADLSGRSLLQLDVLIIGVGHVGSAIAHLLNGRVHRIGLVDINRVHVEFVANEMQLGLRSSIIQCIKVSESDFTATISKALEAYTIGICTTSSLSHIVAEVGVLEKCVVVDDARPEAFPRVVDPQRKVAVLEGGTVRLRGVQLTRNFGFGRRDDVFGCLAETFLLALDGGRSLKPTLGNIDFENLHRMVNFCKDRGFTDGDFKSGEKVVSRAFIREILLSNRRFGPVGSEPTASPSVALSGGRLK